MENQVVSMMRIKREKMLDGSPLLNVAKNIAWELKSDTPMFDIETMEHYWQSLSREQKLKYLTAAESAIQTLLSELEQEKALSNVTIAWLQNVLH